MGNSRRLGGILAFHILHSSVSMFEAISAKSNFGIESQAHQQIRDPLIQMQQ
jgi:hypothetical protein